MKVLWMGVMVVGLATCGGGEACRLSDGSASFDEMEMLEEAAEIMVSVGYERPCCPVTFCAPGEECWEKLGTRYCGRADGLGEDCGEILIVEPWVNPRCPDPMDTIFHEWLHGAGMRDGSEMDGEVAKLMIVYLGGWLESAE